VGLGGRVWVRWSGRVEIGRRGAEHLVRRPNP
jgi:hypothetical protein